MQNCAMKCLPAKNAADILEGFSEFTERVRIFVCLTSVTDVISMIRVWERYTQVLCARLVNRRLLCQPSTS